MKQLLGSTAKLNEVVYNGGFFFLEFASPSIGLHNSSHLQQLELCHIFLSHGSTLR